MASLYELTQDMLQLIEWFDEGEDIQALEDTLEGLKSEIKDKAEDYCKVIAIYESRVDSANKEINRLEAYKKQTENSIGRMKAALLNAMQATGTNKIDGELFKLSIRNNAASLDRIPSIDALPEEYRIKQEDKIDKRRLLADVKSGLVVEGVTLKQSQSLVIK